ncbi:MAG TPA: condensation domain-containing protein, partial [Chitinophagaceae bacterium]|nr:condensation domain-containing protein [Chitinophagaceae bacterium]
HQLEGSVQYHIPAVLQLSGDLNIPALQRSMQSIINRHEVLRTLILEHEEQPYQYILDKDSWQLQLINASEHDDDTLRLLIHELITQPFDLTKDHMLRAHLVQLKEQEQILVVTLHHIASDGWSRSIIVKELAALYASYTEDSEYVPPHLPVQYADYALWQRKYLAGPVLEEKIAYWQEQLTGVSPLQLPTDHPYQPVKSTSGAVVGFSIDSELTTQLRSLALQQGATLYMTLLAAFKVLMHKYSGQQDICIGAPVAGRQQQETESLVGFFINTVALRSDLSNDPSFITLLQQVKHVTLDAFEQQDAPFEKVVEAVVKDRDLARDPIFQVLFTLQNTPDMPDLVLGEVSLAGQGTAQTTTQFEISLVLMESPAGIGAQVIYSSNLFEKDTMLRMSEHYVTLLRSVVEWPAQKISSLNMLSEAEQHQLLHGFNDTAVPYADKTLVDLFEEQVQRTPLAVAVKFRDSQLTYKELDERTNQLAHYLRKREVKQESLVAICLDRSLEM